MTLALDNGARPSAAARRSRAAWVTLALVGLLGVTSMASISVGASEASLKMAVSDLLHGRGLSDLNRIVLWDIRLPRLAMGILVGAALAVSGVVMQGLFRNPLADPGIVGVSAGAGLGAITAIVFGNLLPAAVLAWVGSGLVAVAAFLGGWASVLILYRVSTRQGQTSVATMLLAGIALAALSGAVSGVMVYVADDQQLRDLTFWGMGSLAGATWTKVATAAPLILASILCAQRLARALNGLAMGEAVAHHIGIPVQRSKNIAILTVAAATGAAVAVSGGIGFIGIVVPHLLRLGTGPDHHRLLVNAALLGAALLLAADMISRVIVAPAELPIGIVTAILGAPVFFWILLRRHGSMGM
ncbi:iron complex transport system permease protein [Ruegeria intermedia]|uniref:Iron complex transport system permease protein n=1 Tax=Ruegeria intermedia TaxID=996115 RepID=A0A1M5B4R1_9RHOB|nr:iron ABC transporter permease [Ruegeria intermedia]SHF37396.1 iron complex transport system permease protein [Ruegeria intermedia]